jgi:hypothetical protein
VLLWQISTLFAVGNPSKIQCADAVTVSSAANNVLCGIQGVILMISVNATVMWASYMIFNLHATIVWRSSVFERFKPLGVIVCWGLPGISTLVVFWVSKVDATTGLVCIISPEKANVLFFSFQGVFGISAFLINFATMAHIWILARRSSSKSISSVSGAGTSENSSHTAFEDETKDLTPVSSRRQILLLFKLNWRALLLGFYYIMTYATYS